MSATRYVTAGWRVTIEAWETAVVVRDGALVGSVGPGRHRRRSRSKWHIFDTRSQQLVVPPQELLTQDGLQVRVSVVLEGATTNAERALLAATATLPVLYARLQVALRERVAVRPLTEVLEDREAVFGDLADALGPVGEELGFSVTRAVVRDITLPAELRHAFAQTAMAREIGKAELERARSESASLRSLANAAKLLEQHPSLLQLRALQAGANGAKVVLHLGNGGDSA